MCIISDPVEGARGKGDNDEIRISAFPLRDIGPQGASVLPRLGRMPAGGRMVQRLPSTPAKSLCRLCEEAE